MTRRYLIINERRHSRPPADNMNWEATLSDWKAGDPVGYGATEEEAEADLCRLLKEQAEAAEDDEERARHELDPDLARDQKRDDELWEKLK